MFQLLLVFEILLLRRKYLAMGGVEGGVMLISSVSTLQNTVILRGTVTLEVAPSSIDVSVTSKHVGHPRGWGCASMAGAGHTRNWERAGLPTTYLIFLILPYGFYLPAIRLERRFHTKIIFTQLVLDAYLTTP